MVPPDKGQVPDSNPISANPEAETEIDREEAFQDEASTWDESEQDGDQAAEPLPAPAIMAGGDGQASSLSPGAGDDDDVESGDDEEDD